MAGNSVVVGEAGCPPEVIGIKIETNTSLAECIDGWKVFAKEIGLKPGSLSKLTNELFDERITISDVYTDAIREWCTKEKEKANLELLCLYLDIAKFNDASDAIREKFLLKPVRKIDSVSKEYLNQIPEHISDNINSLTNETTLTTGIEKFVRQLYDKNLITENDLQFLESDNGLSDKMTKAKFYRIFKKYPQLYSNLIKALEKDGQIKPAWILRRLFRKSESE